MRKFLIGAGSIMMFVLLLLLGCENSEITVEPVKEFQNQSGSSVQLPAIQLPDSSENANMI